MVPSDPSGPSSQYAGHYTEFHDWKVEAEKSGTLPQGTQPPRQQAEASRDDSPSEPGAIATGFSKTTNLSKNQINQLEKRIKQIESEIPILEAEAGKLTAQMTDPKIASDYARLAEVTQKLSKTESQIKDLYAEWESAADQLG